MKLRGSHAEPPQSLSRGVPASGIRVAELTILYDGNCNLCRGSVARLRRLDPHQHIETLDLHDPSVPARFPQIRPDEAMRLMQAVDKQGRVYSGADAWARAGLVLPGWKLVAWLLLVPGIHFLAQRVYGWVARNRYRWNRDACEGGTCALHMSAPRNSRTDSGSHS
jgi:predicted DCC family thiol-disulfide oxidoreductase YuxK